MRRTVLILGILLALAVACGGDDAKEGASSQPPAAAPGGTTAAVAAPAQPKGELRVATQYLTATLDVTKGGDFSLLGAGAAETLTKLTPQFKVEPWLAQSVTQVDPNTWRATLRPNATFHDGSPVTAEAVAASFKRSWELLPSANDFISKETAVTVIDTITLQFKTPQPNGAFPNNLASFYFIVNKPGPDGSILTGPYRPTKLTVDKDLLLEAFADHWAGPPPIAKIQIRLVTDPNARVLALQAGDVDMIDSVPASQVKGLPNDFERAIIPSVRVQAVRFNHARPPFNDRAVREAFSLGIDRDALNKVGYDGLSVVMTGPFLESTGQAVVAAQTMDVNRAKSVLDAAGWAMGSDGVRVKDGRRLSATLLSNPQRAEFTPMATAIQAQLKPLGFDIQVQQVQDIGKPQTDGDFDAAMISTNLLPTGDPLYAFNTTLLTGGAFNYGKYANPQLTAIVERLRPESDPAKRQALSREAQEVIKADTPYAYLVNVPVIFAYKKGKVRNFTPHPSDFYFIDNKVSVQ